MRIMLDKSPAQIAEYSERYGFPFWQLRTPLTAYRLAGVDAAYLFNACDENAGADGGQFETSGMMSSKVTGYVPKPVYQALKSLIIEFSQN
jgi:hypothetical protein